MKEDHDDMIELNVDEKLMLELSNNLINTVNGMPVEESRTILGAMVVAMTRIVEYLIDKHGVPRGATEKMILNMLEASDVIRGTDFMKYINLDVDELEYKKDLNLN